jgi:hypothetical protein
MVRRAKHIIGILAMLLVLGCAAKTVSPQPEENIKPYLGKVWNKSSIKLLVGIWKVDSDDYARVVYKWTLEPGEQQPCALQPGDYLVTWCDGKKNCRDMWITLPDNITRKPDGDFTIWFRSGGKQV